MDSSKSSLLLLVALLLWWGRCESSFFQKHKTHVLIRNDLQEQFDMTVHCKSKDNDLGVHVIPPRGSYGFSFRPNFFCTTLFWCNFEWPGASRGCKVYNCYRDYDRCFDCTWSIQSSRPCLYNARTNQYDLCDEW